MHAIDHHLQFRLEQQGRDAGRPDVDRPRHVSQARERAGDRVIALGLALRGRPPEPWPQPPGLSPVIR